MFVKVKKDMIVFDKIKKNGGRKRKTNNSIKKERNIRKSGKIKDKRKKDKGMKEFFNVKEKYYEDGKKHMVN